MWSVFKTLQHLFTGNLIATVSFKKKHKKNMDLWQNTRFHKLTLVTHSAMMVDFFCTAVKEYLSPMFTRIHANIDRECWRIFGK